MILNKLGDPLVWSEREQRLPGPGEVRITVSACGVCRTDLHVVDGELPNPTLPIIPGHEIVGRINALGPGVRRSEDYTPVFRSVSACGVCRTDLHVVDGELPNPTLPIIPGHEIVGRINALGPGVR